MADDVADLLDHLQISKIHLFGVSMGGMIALAFALRFPSRVETLTLGCTTARPRKFNLNPHMAQPIIDSLRQGGAVTPLLISQGFIATNPELVTQFEQRIQQQIVAKNVIWEQIKACWNFDVSSRLQEIGAPTLIMTGDRDLIMPATCSQDLAAQILHSTLKIFAGSGHAFMLENQAEVIKLLSNHWLSHS
jgi:pimeloyl-ACP methyl ester carboxylesterase